MIRSALVFLLSIFLLYGTPAIAACGVASTPVITVVLDATAPVQDHSRSIAALSRFPAARSKDTASYDHALGLTDTSIKTDANVEVLIVPETTSIYCATLTKAMVTIIWRTKVYLASEIPPQSCTGKTALAHEMKHVAVDREMRNLIVPRIKRALTAAARSGYSATNADRSQELLRQHLSAAITQALNAFQAQLRARQLRIDTPEEYDSLGKICGEAEVQRILRQ